EHGRKPRLFARLVDAVKVDVAHIAPVFGLDGPLLAGRSLLQQIPPHLHVVQRVLVGRHADPKFLDLRVVYHLQPARQIFLAQRAQPDAAPLQHALHALTDSFRRLGAGSVHAAGPLAAAGATILFPMRAQVTCLPAAEGPGRPSAFRGTARRAPARAGRRDARTAPGRGRRAPAPGRWCNVTVAQGMEGDGKKEDLTVLLRTSTHRTQKVRSSMEIVQRLRQRYLQFLQVVVDVLTDEVSYRDFEDRLRQELDALGRDIVKWVVESCDEHLREEPQARPGW